MQNNKCEQSDSGYKVLLASREISVNPQEDYVNTLTNEAY